MSELHLTGDPFLDAYDGPRPLRGKVRMALRGGRCVICGEGIARGEDYVWSDEYRRGAHLSRGCGAPGGKQHG
jgi:hypothetical protein